MCKALKIEFNNNYHSWKKGDVVEFSSVSEVKMAEWLLANQMAKRFCDCPETETEGCSECEKQNKETANLDSITSEKKEVVKTKKEPKK